VRKLARQLALGSDTAMALYNACDVLPDELSVLGLRTRAKFPYRQEVIAEACRAYPSEPLRQVMYSDQHTFLCSLLDRNDRMTMGASIECRVPFLDYRLVERAAALPTAELLRGGQRKALLRRALSSRLPAAVRHHKKWGFGVPWSCYLREQPELRELVQSLPAAEPIASGPFERARLHEVVARFLAGDPHVDALVRALAMVALWHQALVANLAEMRRAAA
jgi:asparagine synthase (glutamine-hydrolysing)